MFTPSPLLFEVTAYVAVGLFLFTALIAAWAALIVMSCAGGAVLVWAVKLVRAWVQSPNAEDVEQGDNPWVTAEISAPHGTYVCPKCTFGMVRLGSK